MSLFTMQIDSLPQYNDLVEQYLIGAMLDDPLIIPDIQQVVKPTDFYLQAHQTFCRYIYALFDESGPVSVDAPGLVKKMQEDGVYEANMVSQLTNCYGLAANYEYYVNELRRLSISRQLRQAAVEIANWTPTTQQELESALAKAETKIAALSDQSIRDDHMLSSSELLDEAYDYVERVYAQDNPITGIPSGIPDLDNMTAGFHDSDLIILAGRPSMGKTAFAIQLALNMCQAGKKGIFFEIEMGKISVSLRILANQTDINSKDLRSGQVSKEEYKRYLDAKASLRTKFPLYIDTTPDLSLSQLKAKARKLKRQNELDFLIVDYLQLLKVDQGRSRNEEVNEISRGLKQLARELEIPVIALSQLSRAVESRPRTDRRPTLADLRESGGIEQDADVVLFMYRDEYYNPDTEDKGIAETIIAKQRDGILGVCKTLYKKEYNQFLPLERNATSAPPPLSSKTTTLEELPWADADSETSASSDDWGEL